MEDTYILQKDIISPGRNIPAGAKYHSYNTGRSYVCTDYGTANFVSKDTIRKNPDWFKKAEPVTKFYGYIGSRYEYIISYTKPIDKEDFDKIAHAIDKVLNHN